MNELRCYKNIRKKLSFIKFESNAIQAKSFSFWLAFFGDGSYMGLKCYLDINADTQKVFIFIIGDDHSTYINFNFLNFLLI